MADDDHPITELSDEESEILMRLLRNSRKNVETVAFDGESNCVSIKLFSSQDNIHLSWEEASSLSDERWRQLFEKHGPSGASND